MEDPTVGECAERLSSSCALESQKRIAIPRVTARGLATARNGWRLGSK